MKNRWYRWTFIVAAVVVLVFALRACFSGNDLAINDPQEAVEAELTLSSVTLEQPDENGKLLWRLKAKSVTYAPDTQRADLVGLEGEFFQDGATVYTVEADRGEVLQNGNTLFLRGNLVAIAQENDLTLEGEKMKWMPKQDLLVMGEFEDADIFDTAADQGGDEGSDKGSGEADTETTDTNADLDRSELDRSEVEAREFAGSAPSAAGLAPSLDQAPVTGFNPRIKAVARLMKVSNAENRVELTGGVLAQSKVSPWLMLQSESLMWFTQQERVEASQPLKVEQFGSKSYEVVSDRLVGASGQVELAENKATLKGGVQLDALTQPLTIRSEQAVWEMDDQTVEMNTPVDIKQPARQITAVANQAKMDLAAQVIYLTGDVQAVGEKNDSRLAADSVTWQTDTQQIEADGNVRYQQAADPDVAISGPRAVGNIEAGTVVIEGGESGEVVTEIVPGDF
ncbi:MAG: LPS export ABC transporter periplasmic protein LptC [Phormidesmis sp.]